jgi:Na+-driven multidrug efflux pump
MGLLSLFLIVRSEPDLFLSSADLLFLQRLALLIFFSLTGFFFLPIIGVSAAAQPLLGYNYGAGYLQRVRSALGFAILGGSIIGTIMWLIAHLFPVPIVSLFGVSDQLMDVTVFALQVQLMMFPIISFQIIGSNYFQATGQPMKSILLSLTRQVLFFIPLMFILPEVLPLVVSSLTGLDGLFFTFPFADLLAVFTAGGFLLFELKRLRRLEACEITDRMVSGHRS